MIKVGPYGPRDAKIMLVGEAPGKDEVKEGRPFVGLAGQRLRQFLMMVGIDPEAVYYTNMCKYQPPGNRLATWFDANGQPNDLVLEGLIELKQEINEVKPNVVVALGNFPNWALTGKSRWVKVKDTKEFTYTGIHDHRGSIYPWRFDPSVKVIPTFHPAYILREGMQDHGTWLCDLEGIKRESEFPEIRRPQKDIVLLNKQGASLMHMDEKTEKITLEPMVENERTIKDWLLDDPEKTLTVDIEYMGSKLLCCGMTVHRDTAIVVQTNTPESIDYCRSILTSGIPLNAQNAAFEASILEWHYQMPIMQHVKFDTMLAAHASNPELPKALDYLMSIYTDQPYHKGMIDWKLVAKDKYDPLRLFYYNGIDVWAEHEIMEEQIKYDLCDPAIADVFEHEMLLLAPLWEMSKRGIKIDVPKLETLRATLTKEIEDNSLMLDLVSGIDGFNVKSGPMVNNLLFGKLGLKPLKINKTGPANDDKTLAQIQINTSNERARKIIQLIRDTRLRRDLISKFVDVGFDADGRARGQYNPGGTTTGRLSSSKFYPTGNGSNQQNIPRDKRVRSLFIADTGYEYAYADLERAESLVVAHLTNDPRMLADHAPGVDAHRSLAAILFNKHPDEVDEDERYLGKKTRHAGNYMQGWKTFQTNVNKETSKTGVSIDAAEAKRLIGIYREEHIFLPKWWRETESKVKKDRTLENLVGRRRTFFGHIHSILPECVAFVPQSTVGDVLNIGLLSMHSLCAPYLRRLGIWEEYQEIAEQLKAYGVLGLQQVHDAIGYEYPRKHRDEVNSRMRKLLAVPLTVPTTYEEFTIPVEIKYGPSWGKQELYAPIVPESFYSWRG